MAGKEKKCFKNIFSGIFERKHPVGVFKHDIRDSSLYKEGMEGQPAKSFSRLEKKSKDEERGLSLSLSTS